MKTAYRIPAYDEDPSDELIEFLHANPHEWEGSESGISLEHPHVGRQEAAPGDWIVCASGVYCAVAQSDMDAAETALARQYRTDDGCSSQVHVLGTFPVLYRVSFRNHQGQHMDASDIITTDQQEAILAARPDTAET